MDVQYQVIRSKRKTVCMKVDRNGQVVVRAPLRMRDDQIARFVERHSVWLRRQLTNRPPKREFCDGAEIALCGKTYTVATGERAKLEGGTLLLPSEGREEALCTLMRKLTRERMATLLDRYCAAGGFSYSGLRVTSARGRWGSCSSKKAISFTFRTAFLPDDLAEYLAVHELCHTVRMDHSAQFWRRVAVFFPDYREKRRSLRGYRWAMECL